MDDNISDPSGETKIRFLSAMTSDLIMKAQSNIEIESFHVNKDCQILSIPFKPAAEVQLNRGEIAWMRFQGLRVWNASGPTAIWLYFG